LSLNILPFIDFETVSLGLFALFYGLNFIATLPPTVRITNEEFGNAEGSVVDGWVKVAHQMGAATAGFGPGFAREWTGTYDPASVITGILALVTMGAMLAPHKSRDAAPRALRRLTIFANCRSIRAAQSFSSKIHMHIITRTDKLT
jgi:hypothetical protein